MVVAVREGKERGREGGREVFIVTGCKLLSGKFISIVLFYIYILFYIYSFILWHTTASATCSYMESKKTAKEE